MIIIIGVLYEFCILFYCNFLWCCCCCCHCCLQIVAFVAGNRAELPDAHAVGFSIAFIPLGIELAGFLLAVCLYFEPSIFVLAYWCWGVYGDFGNLDRYLLNVERFIGVGAVDDGIALRVGHLVGTLARAAAESVLEGIEHDEFVFGAVPQTYLRFVGGALVCQGIGLAVHLDSVLEDAPGSVFGEVVGGDFDGVVFAGIRIVVVGRALRGALRGDLRGALRRASSGCLGRARHWRWWIRVGTNLDDLFFLLEVLGPREDLVSVGIDDAVKSVALTTAQAVPVTVEDSELVVSVVGEAYLGRIQLQFLVVVGATSKGPSEAGGLDDGPGGVTRVVVGLNLDCVCFTGVGELILRGVVDVDDVDDGIAHALGSEKPDLDVALVVEVLNDV
jgi:hypothetical protein